MKYVPANHSDVSEFLLFLAAYLVSRFGNIRYGNYVCSDYDSEILDAYIGSHFNPFGFMQIKMTAEEEDKDRLRIIVTSGGLLGNSTECFDAKLCENNLAEKTYVISNYGGKIGELYIGAPVYIRFIPGKATINIDFKAALDSEKRDYDEGATLIKLEFVKEEIDFR